MNQRSPSEENLTRQGTSVRPTRVDVEALLRRIERRHEKLGRVELSPEDVRRLRDEGGR